jgi:hypothetical protein
MRMFWVFAVPLVALSFVVPDGSWWQVGVQALTGYLVSAVLLTRRMWGFATGIAGNATGILFEAYRMHGGPGPLGRPRDVGGVAGPRGRGALRGQARGPQPGHRVRSSCRLTSRYTR